VEAVNTHRATIDRIEEMLGVWGPVSRALRTGTRRRDMHHVMLCSWDACLAACKALRDSMFTKQGQVDVMIEWASDRLARQSLGSKYTVGFTEFDHDCYERLRVLNARWKETT
jgi:hypothetical protein